MYDFVATSLMGIEGMVKNELKFFGAQEVRADNAKVFFKADYKTMIRCLLWSRFSERILLHIGSSEVHTFVELFDFVKSLPWENYIGKMDAFPIKGNLLKSELRSMVSCRSIIKKAVAARLNEKYNISWFEQTGDLKLIRFNILKNKIILMIDICGEGLHKRKYRENFTKAPIKETLASALIDFIRVYDDSVLIDPFCGSGTILIEGAMKALNIAPGLNRNFVCETWKDSVFSPWKEERERAISLRKSDKSFKAFGFDIDEYSLRLASENAKRANVGDYIFFKKRNISDFSNYHDNALIVTNPPYGQRLGDKDYTNKLYTAMAERFRKSNLKKVCVITSEENFEEIYGERATKKRKLYNGMKKCYAYAYLQ